MKLCRGEAPPVVLDFLRWLENEKGAVICYLSSESGWTPAPGDSVQECLDEYAGSLEAGGGA